MPDAPRLTPAQRCAVDWLPADGSWRYRAGRMTAALSSLSLAWQGCVDSEWGPFSADGSLVRRWRLTERGVAKRAAHYT